MDKQALINSVEQIHADTEILLSKGEHRISDEMKNVYNSLLSELKKRAPDNAVIAGLSKLKSIIKPADFLSLAGQLAAAARALPQPFPGSAVG